MDKKMPRFRGNEYHSMANNSDDKTVFIVK